MRLCNHGERIRGVHMRLCNHGELSNNESDT